MGDRDAFGREKGEDPLAEMGWSGSGAAQRESAPADDAPAEASPTEVAPLEAPPLDLAPEDRGPVQLSMPGAPPPVVRRPLRRRRPVLGCVFPLVVLGFIVSVFAVVVPTVIDAIDSVDEIRDGVGGGGGGRGGGNPPAGLEGRSLLRRDNFATALAKLRRETGTERVRLLRVAADRIDVNTVAAGQRFGSAHALWNGEVSVEATTPHAVPGTSFPWSRVDAAGLNRIVRSTTRGRSPASFNYAVLVETGAGLQWSAFLTGDRLFLASPDGRRIRRVG